MDKQYFLLKNPEGDNLFFKEGNMKTTFPETPGNRHYEEYLQWVAEGNTAEVVEEEQ